MSHGSRTWIRRMSDEWMSQLNEWQKSQVTHERRLNEWVMNITLEWVTKVTSNPRTCQTNEWWISQSNEWQKSQAIHERWLNECVMDERNEPWVRRAERTSELRCTYHRVVSLLWVAYVTHMNVSCHSDKRVMDPACRTCENVMLHIEV